jgi:hypothetical protein
MATLGPAVARQHYSWDVIVPKLIERYRGITQ